MVEVKKLKQGIVIESNREYHSYREAISKSRLEKMSVCPSYFKWCEDNPQEPTDDMTMGSAFHKIVLEPQDFDKEFMIMEKFDRRTKEGRLAYEHQMQLVQGGIQAITQEQYDTICGMRDSLFRNKYTKVLLQGNVEQSFYFNDDLTNEYCKCRPDIWRSLKDGSIVIVDLKSTKSAKTEDFIKDVVKYGYDLQTFHYTNGVSKVLNVPKDKISFIFIAVEKKPPYLCNILQADEFILQRGEALFREYIGKLHECRESGNFYGLNGAYDVINNLSLPSYLIDKGE